MNSAQTFAPAMAVVFFAAFVHGLAGFGAALVAMPLLAVFLSVKFVSPLVALLTLTLNLLLLWRGKGSASPGKILPLVAGAAAGVPLGVLFLSRAGEREVTAVLGVILILYALFSLLSARTPVFRTRGGVALGLLSGALGGAFNIGGPPAVVYLSSGDRAKEEIHASLQLYFTFVGVLVVASHAFAGLVTYGVLQGYAAALPALVAGGAAGFSLHRRIDPALYRTTVYGMLLVLGAVMLGR